MARITEELELECLVPMSDEAVLKGFTPTKRCPRCKNLFRSRNHKAALCQNCTFVLTRPEGRKDKQYPKRYPISDPVNEYEQDLQQLGVKMNKTQRQRYQHWAMRQEDKKPKPL